MIKRSLITALAVGLSLTTTWLGHRVIANAMNLHRVYLPGDTYLRPNVWFASSVGDRMNLYTGEGALLDEAPIDWVCFNEGYTEIHGRIHKRGMDHMLKWGPGYMELIRESGLTAADGNCDGIYKIWLGYEPLAAKGHLYYWWSYIWGDIAR